ncbi:NADH-quinone oxidoreductase subunit H [Candidatus Uhrbacteria bacterium]|nr:NADH-quinone oxidoreductase subunit H [Candidatus Uhrbacteria bacterium]
MNTSFLISFIQLVIVLLFAPFVTGLVRLLKARLQGRRGASPFLVYFGLLTMLRKQTVISQSRSWVFRCVPYVVLGTIIFLVMSLPLVFSNAGINGVDLFVIAGVLAMSSVFLVFGGLDSATAFGGMGASREMTLAALVEPLIMTTFVTLAITNHSTLVKESLGSGIHLWQNPALLLTLIAFIFIALSENARYPTDNPATHLELTMVHEAMILEYSGPSLAILEYASSVKLTLFFLLIGNLLVPKPEAVLSLSSLFVSLVSVFMTLIIVSFLLALLESCIAKMRFYRMQEYMALGFIFSLSGLILTLVL